MRGDVPNRLVVSSRDSPMTPPPSVGNGIIRVERIRTRARAGPRARDDRDDRVRLVDDRAADVASERSSSRVESSRVESSACLWIGSARAECESRGRGGPVASADELDSIIDEGHFLVGEPTYSYGSRTRRLPRRIVLVRHGESKGNVDESEYTRTPDSQVRLTARGHVQAESTGRRLRKMMDEDESEYNLFFYISPYRRSKETAIGIAKAFEGTNILGVREEPQLREQDFGNFQDYETKQAEKQERHRFGRFFYRFPNGESGADVYDRITMFSDHMVRDIDAGRFPEDTNMILCTHGLTLRLFLMRWFHWTVAEYERIANPSNSQPIILERRSIEDIEHSMHTKECYVLSQESKEGLRGCSDDMCTMILPEECWTRALQLGPDVNHSLLPPPDAPRPNPDKF